MRRRIITLIVLVIIAILIALLIILLGSGNAKATHGNTSVTYSSPVISLIAT